ncbi:hypothetical protein [Halocella sp. SP3-1]|uniref:hypothetical protein n=1 Tax=Halocella sp. SP3-1 TaxID=2382161 RepID=UPI000F74C4AE|nr:hypothetical protein [Halocella sp. SP3-1]AZO96162.1 hypothetical protein D7D81_17050 [Halocella sp. SP3-1]
MNDKLYLGDYVRISNDIAIPKYRGIKGIVIEISEQSVKILYDDCLIRDFLPRIATFHNDYITKIGRVESIDCNIIYDVKID